MPSGNGIKKNPVNHLPKTIYLMNILYILGYLDNHRWIVISDNFAFKMITYNRRKMRFCFHFYMIVSKYFFIYNIIRNSITQSTKGFPYFTICSNIIAHHSWIYCSSSRTWGPHTYTANFSFAWRAWTSHRLRRCTALASTRSVWLFPKRKAALIGIHVHYVCAPRLGNVLRVFV